MVGQLRLTPTTRLVALALGTHGAVPRVICGLAGGGLLAIQPDAQTPRVEDTGALVAASEFTRISADTGRIK